MNIWILAVYLQILDLLTTTLFLTRGMLEANPVIRFFLKHLGPAGLFLAKSLPIIIIVLIYLIGKKYKPRWLNPIRILTKVNYFYAAVVLWNIFLMNIKDFL